MTLPLTNQTTPSEPLGFSGTAQLNGTILFNWSKPIVSPFNTQFQIIRSTNSADASVGTVVWQGLAAPVPLVMPTSNHWYYGRAIANSAFSAYSPNTFGNYVVARPEADNSLLGRMTPDAEFSQSTSNGSYWWWSDTTSVVASISTTGGEIGGVFRYVGSWTSVQLYSQRTPGYPAIGGMSVRAVARIRRTTAVTAFAGNPSVRLSVAAVNTISGSALPTVEGTGTPLEIIVTSIPLNTWATYTWVGSVQLDVSSLSFIVAKLGFNTNAINGTVEVDALNAFPG